MRRAKKEQLAVRAGGRGLEPDDHARAVEYCADMSKARSSKTNLRTRSGPRRSTESKCGSESKELHSSNDDDDNVAWIPGMPWTEGRKEGRRGWGNLVAVRTSIPPSIPPPLLNDGKKQTWKRREEGRKERKKEKRKKEGRKEGKKERKKERNGGREGREGRAGEGRAMTATRGEGEGGEEEGGGGGGIDALYTESGFRFLREEVTRRQAPAFHLIALRVLLFAASAAGAAAAGGGCLMERALCLRRYDVMAGMQ
ncbi:hypothetical protein AXG93_4625s1050 [Marchantia polymorpha subsp. ruderalis]|uniref:Uncharacterized protein n=1 Tax=Marchantia polymorpha subsp. ruderalis TaxID=1480154 RepID=A0A176VT41_MARPO|nr:hypothetical protein AXG93_4625s1050 [Marchantia polymorpha subsp. ruderalis]